MFRSPLETELLVRDRMDTLAAAHESARIRPQGHSAHHGHPVLNRARHGLGRGLISLGKHLAESRGQTDDGRAQAAPQPHRLARTS